MRSEVGVDEVGEVVGDEVGGYEVGEVGGDEVGGYEVLSGVRWMR